MKTSFKSHWKTKTTKEDGYLEIQFKDYRGEHIVKINEEDARLFVQDIDNTVNWQTK